MTTVSSGALVVFEFGGQRFALDVGAVERVVRAVEIAPLPDAPRGVRGVINVQGQIVPVFDLGSRHGQPGREVRAGDHLIIAHTPWRTVALLVDSVADVVRRADAHITPAADILPDIESISGVMPLDDSLLLVYDIERFLSIEDHEKLQLALDLQP